MTRWGLVIALAILVLAVVLLVLIPLQLAFNAEDDAVVAPHIQHSAQTSETDLDPFENIRNNNEAFSRFSTVPSAELTLQDLTLPTAKADNGPSPEGQFRLACEYSHFSHDDPILLPAQPGESHLHMFYGNTEADAFTTTQTLTNTGGSTCSGFELNRSAYWSPALLDGKGHVVVPDQIIIYYKTKHPENVIDIPQGLQMIAGNMHNESFEPSQRLHWSCGKSGHAYEHGNQIPDCQGDVINSTVQFPNCWDGKNLEVGDQPHLVYVDEELPCPQSHPRRLPQISILLYFPGSDSVQGWHLSSDKPNNANFIAGGTLHADWWGGWNEETVKLWTDNCLRAKRNCSLGQTGTDRELARINDLHSYQGENFLSIGTD